MNFAGELIAEGGGMIEPGSLVEGWQILMLAGDDLRRACEWRGFDRRSVFAEVSVMG